MAPLSGASTVAFFKGSSKRSDTESMSRVRPLKMAILWVFPMTSEIMIPEETSEFGWLPVEGVIAMFGGCASGDICSLVGMRKALKNEDRDLKIKL